MATHTSYVIVRSAREPLVPRIAKWTILVLVVAVAFAAGATVVWLQRITAQVARNNPQEVQAVRPQLTRAPPGRPVNVLILGSDRRAGDPGIGARSDTLLLVRLDPRTGSISMLSVPRDLRVTIPGRGINKINAAYAFGGAKLSLQVVRRLLGIPINDFIDINFDGFEQVVNRLGGAYVMIDHGYHNNTAVTDYASINLQPGYQLLRGSQALSWVRYRHDRSGDFTRIVRQQIFLREMKRELTGSAKLSSLPRFLKVMDAISHNVTSDISSLGKLYRMFRLALQLKTSRFYQTHIEGSTPTIGGISYVVANRREVQAAVHQFLHPVAAPRQAAATTAFGSRRAVPLATSATRAAGSPRDATQWRALQRRASLPLNRPATLPSGLAYGQFRAYAVRTPSGTAKAAVVVGVTPQGGYWDVQALAWANPPILDSPDATRTIAGRSYSLYYDGAHLRLIAWRVGGVAYWVSNTLDEELPNRTMLALATSSVRVP